MFSLFFPVVLKNAKETKKEGRRIYKRRKTNNIGNQWRWWWWCAVAYYIVVGCAVRTAAQHDSFIAGYHYYYTVKEHQQSSFRRALVKNPTNANKLGSAPSKMNERHQDFFLLFSLVCGGLAV